MRLNLIIFLLLFGSCNPQKTDSPIILQDTDSTTISTAAPYEKDLINEDYYSQKDTVLFDYQITLGYLKYDEEEYGFNNPAFLKIIKNGKIIFKDSFGAYENLKINSLGHHLFNKKMLVFSIDYGLKACDYINSSLIYAVEGDNVYKIGEFVLQWTDYASRYFEIVFPEDQNGIENTFIVIDKIEYSGGEEPNKIDTSFFEMTDKGFTKKL